jgi:hypothetical protein
MDILVALPSSLSCLLFFLFAVLPCHFPVTLHNRHKDIQGTEWQTVELSSIPKVPPMRKRLQPYNATAMCLQIPTPPTYYQIPMLISALKNVLQL